MASNGNFKCSYLLCKDDSWATAKSLKIHKRALHIPPKQQEELGFLTPCPAAEALGCPFIARRDDRQTMWRHLRQTHGFAAKHAIHDDLLMAYQKDAHGRDLDDVTRACDKWLEDHPHNEWFNPADMRQIVLARFCEAREKVHGSALSSGDPQ